MKVSKEENKTPLIPPDFKRCQAEEHLSHPAFCLGKPKRERCTNAPDYLIMEKQAGEDEQIGSMTLCAECHKVFVEQVDIDKYNVIAINVLCTECRFNALCTKEVGRRGVNGRMAIIPLTLTSCSQDMREPLKEEKELP